MVQFEGISYLLVALGDGTLFYFNIDPLSGKGNYRDSDVVMIT